MPLAISFELSDRDLEHFNAAIKAAAFTAGSKSEEEVIGAAGKLLEEAGSLQLPDFIMRSAAPRRAARSPASSP